MKLLLLILMTVSCGNVGKTEHVIRAEGSSEIRHVIDIRFDVCDDLPVEDKIVCIESLLEVLKSAVELSKAEGTDAE